MKNNSKFFEKIPTSGMHFIIMWLLWIFFFFDTATDTGVFKKKKKVLLVNFASQQFKPAYEINVVFLYGCHYARRRIIDLMDA